MILSDGEIRLALESGEISISPLEMNHIEPASVDLTLGTSFKLFKPSSPGRGVVNPWDENAEELMHDAPLDADGSFILHPGKFALASIAEVVKLGARYVGEVNGRSSLGRHGLQVHATAGFIDPGFAGQITLELTNVGEYALKLVPGRRVCQLVIHKMLCASQVPYGAPGRKSKYQNQMGATASRSHLD